MSDAAQPEITMYSTGWCPYCDRARGLLQRKGATFSEVKVDEDPAQRDLMLKRSGGRRTVPQIFLGARHVGGLDDLHALDKAGDLDKMLGFWSRHKHRRANRKFQREEFPVTRNIGNGFVVEATLNENI